MSIEIIADRWTIERDSRPGEWRLVPHPDGAHANLRSATENWPHDTTAGWRNVARMMRDHTLDLPCQLRADRCIMRRARMLACRGSAVCYVTDEEILALATEIDRVLDADEKPLSYAEAIALAGWRPSWTGTIEDPSTPRHVLVSGPVVNVPPEYKSPDGERIAIVYTAGAPVPTMKQAKRIADAEIEQNRAALAGHPRFVVMRGAEAVGKRAACFDIAAMAEQRAQEWSAGEESGGYVWRTVEAEDVRGERGFVVDTHAPRVEQARKGPVTSTTTLDAVIAEAARNAGITEEDVRGGLTVAALPSIVPPTDAEIVEAMEARERAAPPAPKEIDWSKVRSVACRALGALSRHSPAYAAELTKALDAALGMGPPPADVLVANARGVRYVPIAEARAAWSRVLAARVRASDEQRKRDAMVYGPIDDGDEAGAKDA